MCPIPGEKERQGTTGHWNLMGSVAERLERVKVR